MSAIIKLSEFLSTGKFGPVEIRNSISTVMKKLGKPDGSIHLKKPLEGIYYGSYEFVFDQQGLRSIQNDRYDPIHPEFMEFSNNTILIDPEFFRATNKKTLEDIEIELIKNSIPYSKIEYWERTVLKTNSGVVMDFNDEEWSDEKDSLVKIEDIKNYELIGIRFYPFDEEHISA